MKRLALTLAVLAAAVVTAESTASALDRSHGRSRSSIGHLVFGGHNYGGDHGDSTYRALSQYLRSEHGYSPSYSRQSYARPSYNYPSRGFSGYGHRGSYNGRHEFGYSYGRCD